MASSLSIYRLRYSFSFNHSGDSVHPGSSTLYTYYRLSDGSVAPYMTMTVFTSASANGVSLQVSPTAGVYTSSPAKALTGTIEIVFNDVTVSGSNFIHQGYELIYNGTTLTSGAAGTLAPAASTSGTPAGIVNIGFGPWLVSAEGGDMVGGVDFKLTSADTSYLTFPVAAPPGMPASITVSNSANLVSYWTLGSNDRCETYAASNEKPLLRRFNTSDFAMVLSRTAVPSVDYSLNGTHTNAIAALSAASGDITGTKGTLETDLLERDHYIGVIQTDGTDVYRFPSRVDGSTTNRDGKYMDEVVDRWSHFSAPIGTPTVNGVVQGVNYSLNNRFQILSDDRIVRICFGSLQVPPGIIGAEVCSYASVTSAAYSSASSTLYNAPYGSKTVGASDVTFTGLEAQITLASLTVTPFCYGILADTIDFTATGTGLRYFLEDAEGNRTEVAVSSSVSLAVSGRRHTVGSWAQDWGTRALKNGGGAAVADIYPDIPSNGKSDTIWPDVSPLKAIGSLLGLDGTWAKLIITATSGSIVITHPTLTRTSDLEFVMESPDATLIGTGTRWARFGGANLTTSSFTIDLPGYPTTLINWLSWKRLVLEGKAYDDGRNTEIVGLGFASGASPTNRHYVDGTLSSFFFGTQIHPHFMWPNVSGSLDQGTGATLDRWEHAPIGARSFGFGADLEVKDSGGTLVSTPGTPVGNLYPSTWEPTTWDKDHSLYCQGRLLATVRPVWCFTGSSTAPYKSVVAYAVRPDLMNFRGRVSGGSATVEAADNALTAWAGVGSTVTAEELCLAVKPYGPILLGVIDAGSYKLYQSTGGSWTLSYTVASTGTPVNPCVIAGSDGVIFHYWSDAGTVKGRRYDGSGTALGAAFSVSGIGAIDEEGISGDESYGGTGERVIRLLVVVSGSLTVYTSTDGEAFS